MDIKERTQYTQAVLSVYVTVFVLAGGVALLGSIVNIVMGLVAGDSISIALLLFLHHLLFSVGAGLAGGWVMAGILGGGWLILEYFHQKKKKVNALTLLLLLFLTIPVGVFVATPFAVYSAVKYKIPLKIEFESNRRARSRKRIK